MEINKDSQAPEDTKVVEPVVPQADAPKEEPGIDYKAEFEKVARQKEQAEYTIMQLKKSVKDKAPEDDGKSKDTDVDARIDARMAEIEAKVMADKRVEAVVSAAKSEDEAKLINWYLDNRIKSSGNITEDVAIAKALANKNVIEKNFESLKETVREKDKFGGSGGSGSQPAKDKKDVALSDADRRLMKSFGVSEDEIS